METISRASFSPVESKILRVLASGFGGGFVSRGLTVKLGFDSVSGYLPNGHATQQSQHAPKLPHLLSVPSRGRS